MFRIYVENIHNHLITDEKHSSWSSKYFLHILFVHLADYLIDYFADGLFERLIDYLILSLMIVHSSDQIQMIYIV